MQAMTAQERELNKNHPASCDTCGGWDAAKVAHAFHAEGADRCTCGDKVSVEFTAEQLRVVFDILNVYDPNDIKSVYPEMGYADFLESARDACDVTMKALDQLNKSKLR